MQPLTQILLVLAFGLPLARGLQLTPLRAPSVRSRSTSPRLAEDSITETSKGLEVGPLGELPILTLEERGDGWDDVRQEIVRQKKEREKPLNELKEWNEKYVAPVARWTKVIAEEVSGAELSAPTLEAPKLSAPKLSAPKLSAPKLSVPSKLDKKKVTKTAVRSVAGAIDRLPKKKPPPSRSPKKKVAKSAAPEAAANVFLLLGVPALTLLSLAYAGLTSGLVK